MTRWIGLIAGGGDLPELTLRGMQQQGCRVACVGMRGICDPRLKELSDKFCYAGALHIGKWFRKLKRWDCSQAVLIGKVHKVNIYDPIQMIRMWPDIAVGRIWLGSHKNNRGDAAILGALADTMQQKGIQLMDQTTFLPNSLADEGVMTQLEPTQSQWADIEYGWGRVSEISRLDIGQSLAVHKSMIIAVEAIEGTDRMILRAGELCRKGGWTMLKGLHANHDMRIDVPTVGVKTIEILRQQGARCLVLAAGKVIMAEKQRLITLADQSGITIVGRA
ncbi:MAG: UDP-2,3-diacylglucosamine diphosphatase LpxI [Phycisphaeraceae bacterium]|nr:UDP-2,3-diacylglucosamine diphosphatase LpxI [Phycisphaeraceae bacterium]